MQAAQSCPACRASGPSHLVETHTDPISQSPYSLYICPRCGVGFSEPRVAVGAEWYASAAMREGVITSPWDWRFEQFFLESLTAKRVLDFGCGSGHFISLAQKRGYEVSGFDFNAAHVELAKLAGAKDAWVMDQRVFLKTHQVRYDAVTLFDVLEHLPEPAEALEGIFNLIAPKGCIAITVPNADRPVPCAYLHERWDYPPFHFTRWSGAALKTTLERIGFKVEKIVWSPLPRTYFTALIYYRLLTGLFPYLKRMLLGLNREQAQKTWHSLLTTPGAVPAPGLRSYLADPDRRQRLVDGGLFVFCLIWMPLEWPLITLMNLLHPRFGRTLYVLARKP